MKEDGLSDSELALAMLLSHEVFGKLPEEIIKEVCSRIEILRLAPDEVLFRQGDTDGSLFLLLKGCLGVHSATQLGKDCELGKILPGDVCGEMRVLYGGKRSATIGANIESLLVRFPGECAEQIECRVPGFLDGLYRMMHRRLQRNRATQAFSQLFGSFHSAAYDLCEPHLEWLNLEKGTVLFKQGDVSDAFYILCSGLLQVAVHDKYGKPKEVGRIGSGECVGEMALLSDEPRSATVRALRRSAVLKLPQSKFDELLEEYPKLGVYLGKLLCRRLQNTIADHGGDGLACTITLIAVCPTVPISIVAQHLARALSSIGPTLHFDRSCLEETVGKMRMSESSESLIESRTSDWLEEREAFHRFVVYETDPTPTIWTRQCLQRAERVLLVAWKDSKSFTDEVKRAWHAVGSEAAQGLPELIVLRPEDSPTTPSNTDRLACRQVESVHHVRVNNLDDHARVARYISGTNVGLVLSGGGARGFAHIGVIKALEELGVPVDLIGGASMGAYVAAQYALGHPPEKIVSETKRAFSKLRHSFDYTVPFLSLLRGRTLDKIIEQSFGDTQIEELWLRYFCVSSNLSNAEIVVHSHGSVGKAVRASMSIPGILPPVLDGNNLLVDGGLLNNVPGDVARSLGCGILIAVDVSEDMDFTVDCDRLPSPWTLFWQKLTASRKAAQVPNIFQILDRSTILSSIAGRDGTKNDADLYLRPQVADFKRFRFEAIEELVEEGYRYAFPRIKEWKRLHKTGNACMEDSSGDRMRSL